MGTSDIVWFIIIISDKGSERGTLTIRTGTQTQFYGLSNLVFLVPPPPCPLLPISETSHRKIKQIKYVLGGEGRWGYFVK